MNSVEIFTKSNTAGFAGINPHIQVLIKFIDQIFIIFYRFEIAGRENDQIVGVQGDASQYGNPDQS